MKGQAQLLSMLSCIGNRGGALKLIVVLEKTVLEKTSA